MHLWELPSTWTQPVAHLPLSPVSSLTEYLEEDIAGIQIANIAGMDDYKRPANNLSTASLIALSQPFFSSGGSINFSRGGTLTDA